MKKIVAACVAYYEDLKHPFDVATNHGVALMNLARLNYDWKFNSKYPPNWQGFIVKVDDDTYQYANREESYEIAKAANQLKSDTKKLPYGLDSYQIVSYDPAEIEKLHTIAINVAKAYTDRFMHNQTPKRITHESLKENKV